MENSYETRLRDAEYYVKQAEHYYESCGETPNMDEIINDAANIFADNFEEYQKIWDGLMK